jgi:hypothetical protein
MTDLTIEDHGSIVIVTPEHEDAGAWLDEVTDDPQRWGKAGIVVEPRYLELLLNGARAEGFRVAWL